MVKNDQSPTPLQRVEHVVEDQFGLIVGDSRGTGQARDDIAIPSLEVAAKISAADVFDLPLSIDAPLSAE